MTIKILTDSCCDLPLQYLKDNADVLEMIGMPIHLEGADFLDDLGENTDLEGFYENLRCGKMASTSQITPLTFENIFRKNSQEGASTIYIGLSSGLSGTMNNALLAKNMVLEDCAEADIHVPDLVSASVGQGLLVIYAVEMVRAGKSASEIYSWLEEQKLHTHHWFAVDNLEYLKNGGRISPAAAKIGTMLNIKPVLKVDYEGRLKLHQNVRGRKKSIKYLAGKVDENFNADLGAKVFIGHGNCEADALQLKALVAEKIGESNIVIGNLAHTIATHVGPDMLAVAFLGGERSQ